MEEKLMNGYVQNVTSLWAHAFKMKIRPGGKVELEDLYELYGDKHSLSRGEEFVNWLKLVKMKGDIRFNTVYNGMVGSEENKKEFTQEEEVLVTNNTESTEESTKADVVSPITTKRMEIEDVVNLSVRKAREVLPGINDVKLLRYALQEATPRAGKAVLCEIIRKRIGELGRLRTA